MAIGVVLNRFGSLMVVAKRKFSPVVSELVDQMQRRALGKKGVEYEKDILFNELFDATIRNKSIFETRHFLWFS